MPGETPDTLRDQIAQHLSDELDGIDMEWAFDDVVRMLREHAASPAGLCGVLGLLGLNTREGFEPGFSPDSDGWFEVYGPLSQYEPVSNPMMTAPWKPVLLVELPSGPATKEDE